jgi:four helix bundle protein
MMPLSTPTAMCVCYKLASELLCAGVMEGEKSLSDRLEERLIEFAARITTLSTELGGTPAGKHIAMQILRSGTAPAPNYAEARGAESRADFIHKLRIVQKELNETSVWLRILLKIVAENRKRLSPFSRKTRNSAGLSAPQYVPQKRECQVKKPANEVSRSIGNR